MVEEDTCTVGGQAQKSSTMNIVSVFADTAEWHLPAIEPWVHAVAVCLTCPSMAVVVASVGVDIDLVPLAADARALVAPEAELVLALPARDVHRATTGLASTLVRPARVVAIEGDWRTR